MKYALFIGIFAICALALGGTALYIYKIKRQQERIWRDINEIEEQNTYQDENLYDNSEEEVTTPYESEETTPYEEETDNTEFEEDYDGTVPDTRTCQWCGDVIQGEGYNINGTQNGYGEIIQPLDYCSRKCAAEARNRVP